MKYCELNSDESLQAVSFLIVIKMLTQENTRVSIYFQLVKSPWK